MGIGAGRENLKLLFDNKVLVLDPAPAPCYTVSTMKRNGRNLVALAAWNHRGAGKHANKARKGSGDHRMNSMKDGAPPGREHVGGHRAARYNAAVQQIKAVAQGAEFCE